MINDDERVVFFDVDGTLITGVNFVDAIKRTLKRLNIYSDEKIACFLEGIKTYENHFFLENPAKPKAAGPPWVVITPPAWIHLVFLKPASLAACSTTARTSSEKPVT